MMGDFTGWFVGVGGLAATMVGIWLTIRYGRRHEVYLRSLCNGRRERNDTT
jgi:hypothetical protein